MACTLQFAKSNGPHLVHRDAQGRPRALQPLHIQQTAGARGEPLHLVLLLVNAELVAKGVAHCRRRQVHLADTQCRSQREGGDVAVLLVDQTGAGCVAQVEAVAPAAQLQAAACPKEEGADVAAAATATPAQHRRHIGRQVCGSSAARPR